MILLWPAPLVQVLSTLNDAMIIYILVYIYIYMYFIIVITYQQRSYIESIIYIMYVYIMLVGSFMHDLFCMWTRRTCFSTNMLTYRPQTEFLAVWEFLVTRALQKLNAQNFSMLMNVVQSQKFPPSLLKPNRENFAMQKFVNLQY